MYVLCLCVCVHVPNTKTRGEMLTKFCTRHLAVSEKHYRGKIRLPPIRVGMEILKHEKTAHFSVV